MKFYFFIFSFRDVIQHKAVKHKSDGLPTKDKPQTITTTVRQTATFVPLAAAFEVDWTEKEYSSRLRKGDPSYFVTRGIFIIPPSHTTS